jgi:ATP-dependent Lon protease
MENQLKKHNRMTRDEKKADKPKASSRNLRKKRSGRNGGDDDDDDVDSKGNIRGLIAYSEETDEETPRSSSKKTGFRPAPRKAAIEAKTKISREQAKVAEADAKKKRGFLSKKKRVVESESEDTSISASEDEDEDEDLDEDEDEDLDEDEDEEDEEDWDEEDEDSPRRNMILNFGFGEETADTRMIPKRYKIKKESQDVQKFFKLMTEPIETETIDDHIDQFKTLKPDEQKRMLMALENRPKAKEQPVMFKILNMQTSPEIQSQLMSKYNNLQALDPGSGEYYKMRNWLEKATALPLGMRKQMPVKVDDGPEVCSAFMSRAKKCLDDAIFGQNEAKLQILQFIAGKITNPQANGMSLLLIGPPGIGKTSLIKQGIAKALD